ncbi:MAG TPA: caspase family protein, partial [Polyangia bacterium]|nr:caspase family protein [Polyangia bacterium]
MNRRPLLLLLAVAAVAASLSTLAVREAAAAEPPPNGSFQVHLRRFALLIGVNDGGGARAKLRYATSDARSMARVLENLGGVAPADLVFVSEPRRAAALDGFAQVEALMRAGQAPGVRRELLVYYSGHSDEEGLLLGDDRVSYAELRARIKALPADLRVAILDSCASGAFTRAKGGVRRPPFLVDASTDMRGHAFLTSSAANEVAQESDRIAASFFTYYLVSGLRGAADVNQDHRVTLQEAYQFASQETLARTERTKGGPQHAAYEFELSGTGDMVVTDMRTTQASLVLAPDVAGRLTVREAGGGLVAELRKPAGKAIELGVEAGSYVVALDAGGGTVFEASATLASGERADLSKLSFHPGAPLEVAVARGDGPAAVATTAAAPAPPHARMGAKLGLLPRDGDERI